MSDTDVDTDTATATARTTATHRRTVAITRSPEDAAEFVELAHSCDVDVHALPTIQLVGKGNLIVDEFLDAVEKNSPDYVVFMSSKAVRLLFDTARSMGYGGSADNSGEVGLLAGANGHDDRIGADGHDDRIGADGHDDRIGNYGVGGIPATTYDRLRLSIANMTVVAVGPKTRQALECEGIVVNEMPPTTYSSVGVGELFTMLNAVGRRVIVPRSGASTPFLRELLSKIGLDVIEVYLYDVCTFAGSSDAAVWNNFRAAFASNDIDGIVLTSESSVRGCIDIMASDYNRAERLARLSGTILPAIGPFTDIELKKAGMTDSIVSRVHTVPGAFERLREEMDKRQQQQQ